MKLAELKGKTIEDIQIISGTERNVGDIAFIFTDGTQLSINADTCPDCEKDNGGLAVDLSGRRLNHRDMDGLR